MLLAQAPIVMTGLFNEFNSIQVQEKQTLPQDSLVARSDVVKQTVHPINAKLHTGHEDDEVGDVACNAHIRDPGVGTRPASLHHPLLHRRQHRIERNGDARYLRCASPAVSAFYSEYNTKSADRGFARVFLVLAKSALVNVASREGHEFKTRGMSDDLSLTQFM